MNLCCKDQRSEREKEERVEANSVFHLPDGYDPLVNLDQVERLLNFKLSETDQ